MLKIRLSFRNLYIKGNVFEGNHLRVGNPHKMK